MYQNMKKKMIDYSDTTQPKPIKMLEVRWQYMNDIMRDNK